MLNLYSLDENQDIIWERADVTRKTAGTHAPVSRITCDSLAPVVRTTWERERELTMMRWGFPLPGGGTARSVTSVRGVRSSYWRSWLARQFRCLVPATSFCVPSGDGSSDVRRYGLIGYRRLLFFAGIWRPWRGNVGTEAEPDDREHMLYSILDCEANDVVKSAGAEDMPVILLTPEDIELWMTGSTEEALTLQRPLADVKLKEITASESGERAA